MSTETKPFGCKCTNFARHMTGDGCDECNPALAYEHAKQTIADLEHDLEKVQCENDDLHQRLAQQAHALAGAEKALKSMAEELRGYQRLLTFYGDTEHGLQIQEILDSARKALAGIERGKADDAG